MSLEPLKGLDIAAIVTLLGTGAFGGAVRWVALKLPWADGLVAMAIGAGFSAIFSESLASVLIDAVHALPWFIHTELRIGAMQGVAGALIGAAGISATRLGIAALVHFGRLAPRPTGDGK